MSKHLTAEQAEAEIAHTEATKSTEFPRGTTANRPNQRRAKILAVRLNPDEVEAVQHQADERGIPASTLVRSWITERINGTYFDPADFELRLRRIEERTGDGEKKETHKATTRKSA